MGEECRVLVVDDDENIRRIFQRQLERQGYVCKTACDGAGALELLRSEEFHVALMDLQMPRMTGAELLTAMKEQQIDTSPVVLTGHGEVSSAVNVMKLGAFDLIQKPSLAEVVLGTVQRAAEHYRVVRRARMMTTLAEQWEMTFDASPDMMLVLDAEGRIVRCNQSVLLRVSKDRLALVGRSCHDALCSDEHLISQCPLHAPAPGDSGPPVPRISSWRLGRLLRSQARPSH